MSHSNKPQPDYSLNLDGSNPYGSLEEQAAQYALLSPEARAQEELEYEEGARRDQYDGYDTGDLNNPAAWLPFDDELDGPVTLTDPISVVCSPAPVGNADDADDILF